jgi:hypothetical protein
MRKRLLAAVVAGGALFLAVPAQSSADDFNRECDNGKDPIVVTHVHKNPLVKGTVRVLCL